MNIKTDQRGFVTGYAIIGELEGATIYEGEVPEEFTENCTAFRLVDGKLVFDADKNATQRAREATHKELAEIYEWFVWYDNQMMQYNRTQRLGEAFDRDMAALDEEANTRQARIREIREILEG